MLLLVGFALVAAACLVGGFWLIDGDLTLLLVKYGGYWLLLLIFLVFLISIFKDRKQHLPNPSQLFRQHRWAFVFSAFMVGVFFLLQEPWFKITMDEVVLAATSMHMHFEKAVFTASRGYEVNGVFYILGGYLDKRPYFFAFVVSLVHDLFGYRSGNVFYVNAVVSFLLLCGSYLLGSQFGGKRWGWLAMLLLLSLPLTGVNVTGGGFELFNLLMILLTAYLGKRWLDNPSPNTLVSFSFAGVLLAQCRYESILFVIPVGLLILWVWIRDRKVILSWPVLLTPLALVPYVLQNRLLNESKVLWQLEEHQSAPFGLQYLGLNLRSAGEFFLNIGNDQANSPLLLLAFVLALLLWLVYLIHFRAYYPSSNTSWRPVGWMFGLTILLNFVLLMFYYWGQLSDHAATRLGLPLHLAAVFFVVFVLSRSPWAGRSFPSAHIAAGAAIWFLALPNIAQSRYMRLAYEARQVEWLGEKLKLHEGPILVVSGYHMKALVEGVSGVPIRHAISRKPELAFHMQQKTFSEVLLVHRDSSSSVVSDKPDPFSRDELTKHFELELVHSYQLGPGEVALISRIKAVRMNEEEQARYQDNHHELTKAASEQKRDLTAYFSKWLP